MAVTNHERVGRALELLKAGLRPYVEREYQAHYGETWRAQAAQTLRQDRDWKTADGEDRLDVQALLSLMQFQWNEVFRDTLGAAERSLVNELRDVRNRWAHQQPFSGDDAYRALDSAARLLTAISADEAREVERAKNELLRVRFEEQARRETRKAAVAATEGQPQAGLRPWREVITPHPNVASGRYQQAEFAADLAQVHRGEGTPEYSNPREFFRRTFLTEGLRHLLVNAVTRLSGAGGDPVVELQTNFGGGKTHSMLALYHLCSGIAPAELPGIEPVLEATGFPRLPSAKRAVLVGTALSPAHTHTKPDGTVVRTLWGEMAWQLGRSEGYALVAGADAAGVSPGSDALRTLFERFGPCLVLIDEWVAYVRMLYGKDGLPAGSFDANLTFAQSLTEAARQASKALVVASIPASDIEKGGEGGILATERIKNTFGRMESAWRPASTEEGFEIVRRRLFEPITEPHAFAERDAVVGAFSRMYVAQAPEFPPGCREGDYERRLQAAYPIHPELFDRLYTDWSSLDKFQRTRGVLRLMAAVIHELWERQDGSLLILPGIVPVDAPAVQPELTRYLDDPWVPVIEKDVDGPHSLPLALDRANPNLGRYSACRRVARTLYLGSAPTLHTSRRGLDDRSVKLGCVQPGESVATFGDALRRLTDDATHLYVDGRRYWLSTQPSVTRLAQDRAAQLDRDVVLLEIKRRLQAQQREKGDFHGVHPAPGSSSDVPDEHEARLVLLAPEYPHSAKACDSPARLQAQQLLHHRGTAPRLYRNALVFLAPDKARLDELEQAVRQYLAWSSIDEEKGQLNLDEFQRNQARTKRAAAEEAVTVRIPETYSWLLVPGQPELQGGIEWTELRLQVGQGSESLATRAGRKLRGDGLLVTQLAGTTLRYELDRALWRERDHLSLKTLWDYLATYLYLPRLRDQGVLVGAIEDGVARLTWERETFACADGWDEATGRYRGLVCARQVRATIDGSSVLVKPEAALRQIEADRRAQEEAERAQAARVGQPGDLAYPTGGDGRGGDAVKNGGAPYGPGTAEAPTTPSGPPKLRRFHGVADLDSLRIGRDAGRIAEEVVQHLSTLPAARVRVRIEIEAEIPDGAPENVVRTVSENCRTLKFISQGFEEE